MVAEFREAEGSVWGDYLEEVASLVEPLTIGSQWPKDGYYLPDRETFVAECATRSAAETLEHLLRRSQVDR